MSVELAPYEAACRAIAEAARVDEVKNILDVAAAMQEYARRAKNHKLETDAVAIRMRATRRLGQLRLAQKETVGLGAPARGRPCRFQSPRERRKEDTVPAPHNVTPASCHARALAEHADAVANIIEIGRRLAEAKRLVGHGNWLPRLNREFGWTEQTALNFMCTQSWRFIGR